MPDLRAKLKDKHIEMLSALAAQYGYEGHTAKADMLAHLISEAYVKNGYSNRWADLRAKAARTLSTIKNWPNPIQPVEIRTIAFRDGSVSIGTKFSGEPYQIRSTDWDSNDE